jgi:hypothetical protein
MNGITDTTFGLNHQALSVLHLLSKITPHFAFYNKDMHEYEVRFETKPWYNGRECGFMLSMGNGILGHRGKEIIHIAVFEHRNSDSICCLKWTNDSFYWNSYNGDFSDAYQGKNKWNVAFSANYGEIGKVAEWIMNTLEVFYSSNWEKQPNNHAEAKHTLEEAK